jgi:Family of unknown function (DUF6262)
MLPMRADNTRHLIAAARQRHELTRAKAIQALRTLDAEGDPVTFEAVAQAAAVSRSWLYAQPDVRAEIERLRAAHRRAPATPVPSRQRCSDASLLRRLEPANQRNRMLAQENRNLRQQLAPKHWASNARRRNATLPSIVCEGGMRNWYRASRVSPLHEHDLARRIALVDDADGPRLLILNPVQPTPSRWDSFGSARRNNQYVNDDDA